MDTGAYRFADLDQHSDLIDDLTRLEAKMKDELGEDIALIAYAKSKNADAREK